MAAQDIRIQRPNLANRDWRSESALVNADDEPALAQQVLGSLLRRRWWLLVIISAVSVGVGIGAALQFGTTSAKVSAALLHIGLPGGDAFKALPPATCAEMITSVPVLNKLREARGLEVPAAVLRSQLTTKISSYSNLLNITLEWDDPQEGVDTLNTLLEIFVEAIAMQRKATLREHVQDIELAQLQARTELDEVRQQIESHREQQQNLIEEGGLSSERYRSAMDSVSNTELAIDELQVKQLGTEQQIGALARQIEALKAQQRSDVDAIRKDLWDGFTRILASRKKTYAANSSAQKELDSIAINLAEKLKELPEEDVTNWVAMLNAELSLHKARLTAADLQAIDEIQSQTLQNASKLIDRQTAEISSLSKSRQVLELSLIPARHQLELLEKRLSEYKAQADAIGTEISGIGIAASESLEQRLETAAAKERSLDIQADTMRRLEKSRVREWTVSAPAGPETTELDDNHKKVFVLAFGISGILMSAPVILAERNRFRILPQARFAKSLRLPVLNERALEDFMPSRRRRAGSVPDAEQIEILRTIALRIQQSAHQSGAMILFSSIESCTSAAPLLAAIAECLAEREERVLVVDAVSPDKTCASIVNLISEPLGKENVSKKAPTATSALVPSPGLAEYLSEECESVGDLIHASGRPGIDVITSGKSPFPREAMASSCLTQLLDLARSNYTMILVHGPAVTQVADMQMLTARADGVVLVASRSAIHNPAARSAVTDLIDVGAPIIGVVA